MPWKKSLMSKESPREIVTKKLNFEISKKIKAIIDLAKLCGIGELFYYLHYLHAIRLLRIKNEIPDNEKGIVFAQSDQLNDTCKYLIQIIAKHSQKKFVKSKENSSYINSEFVQLLTELTLEINSNHENLTFITLFKDIKVYGERNRYFQLDMEALEKDPRAKKFFEYGLRIDRENDFFKSDLKTKDNFLNHFKNEYEPYSDLFKTEFNIELSVFLEFIDFVIITISSQINENEKYFAKIDDNLIDVQAYTTIMNFSKSLVVKKELITEKFGTEINTIIDKLTFDPSKFDENQLRYNLIARQPIIDFGNNLLISPEILLDSLFVNSHYSLLENSESKDIYKAKYSSIFLNSILETSKKYGYEEVNRELDLYEGKNQLGDIDLIIKNSNGEYLLIEAKNHSLPLDVYFHDFEHTEKRLKTLIKDWEKKVNRRNDHLKSQHSKYGIPDKFKYIIVTKSPEILSHFSSLLVLTIRELDYYLSKNDFVLPFDLIFNDLYKLNERKFTIEQLEKLNPGMKMRKKTSANNAHKK